MREIGGRNDERLGAPSPSARLGRGFFSSINDTVSMAGFGGLTVSAGLGVSGGFDGASTRDFSVTAAWDFRAASVCDLGVVGAWGAGLFFLSGGSALAVFGSFRFGSAAAALD